MTPLKKVWPVAEQAQGTRAIQLCLAMADLRDAEDQMVVYGRYLRDQVGVTPEETETALAHARNMREADQAMLAAEQDFIDREQR